MARRFVLVGLLVVLSGCWAEFRGGPSRTGNQPFESTVGLSNVSSLVEAWSGVTGGTVRSSPAIAGDSVFVGSSDGKLYAFDSAGNGCSGTPRVCAPRWTGQTGAEILSSPVVAGGVVYVGSYDSRLYAFDASGTVNCSGVPKACRPLWTAVAGNSGGSTGSNFGIQSSPTVVDGVVYVSASNDIGYPSLYAFDASGSTGCGGTPKACSPLWTAWLGNSVAGISSPAVVEGTVYVGAASNTSSPQFFAFDADGAAGCSGVPKVCAPIWSATPGALVVATPAVVDGVAYLETVFPGRLLAYDARGVTGCGGSPKSCSPLWTASAGMATSSVAVANAVAYLGTSEWNLVVFDARGIAGCTGTPKVCAPLWRSSVGAAPSNQLGSSPAVANGVVYIGSADGAIRAYDAAGTKGCSGAPRVCSPLWSRATGGAIVSSPAVVGGTIYVGSDDRRLHAFRVPGT